jgi:hypothetical protein
MKEERRLTSWLADYRDSLDEVSTPIGVESVLRAELRRRRRIPVAPWLLAAGAAAVLLLGIWIGRSRSAALALSGQGIVRSPAIAEPQAPESQVAEPQVVEIEPIVPRRSLPAGIRPRLAPVPQSTPGPATVFVMLPGSDLLPPVQDLQVLRVRIPRTRIQALGWPVNVDRLEERVLADVVVGDDGVARAIRLVQAEQ